MTNALNYFPTTHAFNLVKSIFGMAQVDYTMLVATTAAWLIMAFIINRIFFHMGRKKGTLVKVG